MIPGIFSSCTYIFSFSQANRLKIHAYAALDILCMYIFIVQADISKWTYIYVFERFFACKTEVKKNICMPRELLVELYYIVRVQCKIIVVQVFTFGPADGVPKSVAYII